MVRKVAAYCRVSTDSSDQANSLASQEKYFREYINRNPEWELAQVWVDTGITGTSTKKRAAFNRMISEAMEGRFDLILTKEISRFARNTLDSIYYTRELKKHGVGVIFMNDNINTLDPDAELRLTIMSSIAQEESRKTSERVKWGQKRSMEQGVVFGRDMLGYDVRDGRLYINEEGAETVRLIFHKFVNEGKGAHVIARELRESGIPTSAYMKQWSNTAILRVLRNEKYCGDLIQKKTITPNYLSHEKKYNRGEEEFVILRDHHEPIVCRELFDRAQRELKLRSPKEEQKIKHSNRYCFSGKIKCGVCGCSFVSRTKKRTSGTVYKAWRCYQASKHGSPHTDRAGNEMGCCCPSVNDEALKDILKNIVKSLQINQAALVIAVGEAVAEVLQDRKCSVNTDKTQEKIKAVNHRKQGLIELYLAKDITRVEFQQMKEKYERDMEALRQDQLYQMRTQDMYMQAGVSEKPQEAIEDIKNYISGLIKGESWNDVFYRNILDKIAVAGDGAMTITLNCMPCKWTAVILHPRHLYRSEAPPPP